MPHQAVVLIGWRLPAGDGTLLDAVDVDRLEEVA